MGLFRKRECSKTDEDTLRKIKSQQADHETRIAALEERKRLLKTVLTQERGRG